LLRGQDWVGDEAVPLFDASSYDCCTLFFFVFVVLFFFPDFFPFLFALAAGEPCSLSSAFFCPRRWLVAFGDAGFFFGTVLGALVDFFF
jgi:hypothetical protein